MGLLEIMFAMLIGGYFGWGISEYDKEPITVEDWAACDYACDIFLGGVVETCHSWDKGLGCKCSDGQVKWLGR